MDNNKQIRPTDLAETLGISVAYASQLLTGARVPSLLLALQIFDKSGVKLGKLEDASDEDIEVIRKVASD
jgi:transcriptional regulator with XRE-family HTH domain